MVAACFDKDKEEIFTIIWNSQAFYSLQIEHYALKIAFCVQCYSVLYFPTAYYSVYGVNSYTSLNINVYVREVIFSNFSKRSDFM